VLLAACGSAAPADQPISRDRFLDAWTDLRSEQLRNPRADDLAARMDEILRAHDVSPADLLDFIDAHAGDIHFLTQLWKDAAERLGQDTLGILD